MIQLEHLLYLSTYIFAYSLSSSECKYFRFVVVVGSFCFVLFLFCNLHLINLFREFVFFFGCWCLVGIGTVGVGWGSFAEVWFNLDIEDKVWFLVIHNINMSLSMLTNNKGQTNCLWLIINTFPCPPKGIVLKTRCHWDYK